MIQVTIAASQIDKARLGLNAISLTNFFTTSEPSVAAGSKVECGGALYEATADETATGWAGLTASAIAYLLLTPSGATASFSYTNTAPTYDTAKQGFYTGSNRVVAMLYKDAASLYQFKNVIPQGQDVLGFMGTIQSIVNPFIFNLPAASATGRRIRIVNTSILSTGLVTIAPNGADLIGSAGNVSCYLQNVDQSAYVYKFQFLDLVDSRSGYWAIVGGQLCPAQAVDTNGQQYHLGKLHHLPLANTTVRTLGGGALVPTAPASWYASAITGTGVVGIPVGAKGIRVKVYNYGYSTAAGGTDLTVGFSDNNSNIPSIQTAHPVSSTRGYAAGGGAFCWSISELDIPLNSLGQFYMYTIGAGNITLASSSITLIAVGFYMGD
jgi:hypothetical protein